MRENHFAVVDVYRTVEALYNSIFVTRTYPKEDLPETFQYKWFLGKVAKTSLLSEVTVRRILKASGWEKIIEQECFSNELLLVPYLILKPEDVPAHIKQRLRWLDPEKADTVVELLHMSPLVEETGYTELMVSKYIQYADYRYFVAVIERARYCESTYNVCDTLPKKTS